MNTKTNYQRKLAHPDWQKKRLEILQRDNFTCNRCDSKDKELHVHHIYYLQGIKPENYPDNAYLTLCYNCHQIEEGKLNELDKTAVSRLRKCLGDSFTIDYLIQQIEKFCSNFSEDGNAIFYVGDNLQEYNFCTKEQQKEIDLFRFSMVLAEVEKLHNEQKK